MVATTDCAEKSKSITGNKVSKPLMEKKRRARINKCLDQLKLLLESFYSSNIRKRKLEKADILELTVKHLRNLQRIQSCSVGASEFSDHQTGFRSCLANVDQYLIMADTLNGGDRWMVSQLSGKLSRSLQGRGQVSSTMDSGLVRAEAREEDEEEEEEEARRLLPPAAGPEEGNTARPKVQRLNSAGTSRFPPSEEARQSRGAKQAVGVENSPSHKKRLSVSHRNEAANSQHSVWRPW
ncbi:hairy-related 3 [Hippoglossus hippoglossus]|uniref:hairy-related 3 n=1 Tax=Hippoglossus hippoglossus TaxID=8267 RepID=UPI00148D7E97|nr:hairy-related 3 [Hippoglossus hippoglossus]